MKNITRSWRAAAVAALVAGGLTLLAGCASADPLGNGSGSGGSGSGGSAGGSDGTTGSTTLVVGSQDYYSNEIIAELYAQALEAEGFTIDRQLRIGQREVYLPELEAGKIDVFPEYTGNLLQYLAPKTTATKSADVYGELHDALPKGLRALEQSEASDQDSYVVTAEFAKQHNLTSIGDLAGIDGLTVGGNSELETRPYGPKGLAEVYGVQVGFTPIEDSGGPLTVKALRDGQVQLVDLYSADPVLASGDLVVLTDPKELFLASHVVPLASERVDERAAKIINAVSAKLTPEGLQKLGAQSVNDGAPASKIAAGWLAEQGLGGGAS